jgi:hypothetical protein
MTPATLQDHHAPMDLTQSLRTYHGFLVALRYVVLAHIVVASFLLLAFAGPLSIGGALFVGLIELIVGLYFARDRKKVGWQSTFSSLFISTGADSAHEVEDLAAERAATSRANTPPRPA